MTDFDVYQLYRSISLHFSTSYDFFRYNGKSNVSKSKYDLRNDRYYYQKLAKAQFHSGDLKQFLACNFFREDNIWVGNIFDEKYKDNHNATQKRLQSLEYIFKTEMSQFDSLDEAFVVNNGQWPKILEAYKWDDVSPETMLIVMQTARCFDYWSQKISEHILWPRLRVRLEKYSPFVSIDVPRFSVVLNELDK